MNHGSLFSGIGGWDIAAHWMGWNNLLQCEIDPFCQTILKYHFPDAQRYTDITTTDFRSWNGKIDVLSGSFPCQAFSQAGKRRGTTDSRYLWPEMYRAVQEIRPRWVLAENVLGIVNWNAGVVFEKVHTDLEAAGYSVQTYVLPACGVNAPHQRYRTWFVAHSNDHATSGTPGEYEGQSREERLSERDKVQQSAQSDYLRGFTSDSECNEHRGPEPGGASKEEGVPEQYRSIYGPSWESCRTDTVGGARWNPNGYVTDNTGGYGNVGYTYNDKCSEVEQISDGSKQGSESSRTGSDGLQRGNSDSTTAGNRGNQKITAGAGVPPASGSWPASNTDSRGLEGTAPLGRNGEYVVRENRSDGENSESSDTDCEMSQCRDNEGQEGWNFKGFGTEPFGFPLGWEVFPTQPPICGGDDGFSALLHGITFPRWRKESIKAYGNAIVPQLAYRIYRVIEYMSHGR